MIMEPEEYEEECQIYSRVDWELQDNILTKNLQKIFDEHKQTDSRFSCIGLSDIFKEPNWNVKPIKLKNPEQPYLLALRIFEELESFKEKFFEDMESETSSDSFTMFDTYFFGPSMTLEMIYHKICHSICKWYMDQVI